MEADPTYRTEIVPFALRLLGEVAGRTLDLGCGEGQLLRALPRGGIGCDLSQELLLRAAATVPVVRCRLPDLGWLRDGSVAAATCVLVLEHLPEIDGLFGEAARVLRPGGVFVLVMNHPAYTADGAGPVVDLSDGEVLWRWGEYFNEGAGSEPAGESTVVFHHRSLGVVLNAAAASGLVLEHFEERGFSPEALARDASLTGQEHFPRLLGSRWRRAGTPNIG